MPSCNEPGSTDDSTAQQHLTAADPTGAHIFVLGCDSADEKLSHEQHEEGDEWHRPRTGHRVQPTEAEGTESGEEISRPCAIVET